MKKTFLAAFLLVIVTLALSNEVDAHSRREYKITPTPVCTLSLSPSVTEEASPSATLIPTETATPSATLTPTEIPTVTPTAIPVTPEEKIDTQPTQYSSPYDNSMVGWK